MTDPHNRIHPCVAGEQLEQTGLWKRMEEQQVLCNLHPTALRQICVVMASMEETIEERTGRGEWKAHRKTRVDKIIAGIVTVVVSDLDVIMNILLSELNDALRSEATEKADHLV